MFKFIITLTFLFSDSIIPQIDAQKEDTRIVGGVQATKNEFPWLVVMNNRPGSNSLRCGGSILNSEWIITAAHCVEGVQSNQLEIVAGDHDRGISESTEQSRNVRKIVIHQNYSSETYSDDIALLKLSTPLNFNSAVNSINLTDTNFASGTVMVAGWGTTRENGSPSSVLMKVSLDIVPLSTCQINYNGIISVTNKQICAGVPEGGKDACQGDSGGPLLCRSNNKNVLCGIVSFGSGCARKDYPGVYTNVASYVDWINTNSDSVTTPNVLLLLTVFSFLGIVSMK